MDQEQLVPIIRSIQVPGWRITPTGFMGIEVRATDPPEDTYYPGEKIELSIHFVIRPSNTYEEALQQIFDNIQFLVIHELKEQFKVNGVRVYDPHKEIGQ